MDYILKSNIISMIERFGVLVLSTIVSMIVFSSNLRLDLLKNYQGLFSNTISFSSILIGVLMTMVALILGYANKAVIKRIRERNAEDILVNYFIQPIISGFTIIIMSLVLSNIFDENLIGNENVLIIITIIWVFIVMLFISSTIRVVWLMLYILKEVFHEDVKINEEQGNKSSLNNELDFDKDCF